MLVRAKNRRTRAERQLREKAELDVLLLQRELDLRQNERPPLCRPETAQWDWRCRCGNLVWAGRKHCLMCNSSRAGGYTVTGSTKGQFLTTPAVVVARENQRVVPGYGFQSAGALVRGAPPPTNSGVGGNTTRSADSHRPATFLEAAKRAQATTLSGAETRQVLEPEIAAPQPHHHHLQTHDKDDDREAEDEAIDPTLLEEMGYEEVRRALAKLERALQRRTRRHKNELERAADKQRLIDAQQAELVLLQSTADSTEAEMQDCRASIAELSERQAGRRGQSEDTGASRVSCS